MRTLRFLLTLILFACVGAAFAQDADTNKKLDDLRDQITQIKTAKTTDLTDAQIDDLRSKVTDLQGQAQKLSVALQPNRDAAKARLDQLGPAPTGTTKEAPELATQRKDAQKGFDTADGQVKQADAIALDATQLASQLSDLRRTRFQETISRRTNSPFSKPFWSDTAQAFPRDYSNLRDLTVQARDDLAADFQPGNRVPFFICTLFGLLLITVVRWYLERRVFKLTTDRMPAGRLRRSAMALAITFLATFTTGLGAQLIYQGVNWNGTLSEEVDGLAKGLVRLFFLGAFVAGLGRALLSPKRPSWRLPTLSDETADKLRRFPFYIATAAVVFEFIKEINRTTGASLAATVVTSFLHAAVLSALITMALVRLSRTHRLHEDGTPPTPRPIWASVMIAAATLCVVASWLGMLSGYIAFAVFISRQIIWTTLVVGATYLAMRLVDDLFETLLSEKGPMSARAQAAFGMDPKLLDQAGVLLSGVARLALFLFGVSAVMTGFGAGATDIIALGGKLEGMTFYGLAIQPDRILGAIGIFFLGLLAVRILKNWLAHQWLPRTSLDAGMRSSLTTLLGYAGGVLVFAFALFIMGLSVQNIAWVASALSVGIGFGLQAIVQNFISGLILLAERPVKVGDWVVLDDAEGDIRRINVRATEIQMGDRSTVIVPNSSFITKPVRNMTMANPQGRVQIKLPMPLDTDASAARTIMLESMKAHPAVQATPPPTVQLDSVDRTAMMFVATAYVGSPRDVGNVRSDLLFDVLARLRGADIPLLRPQDLVLRSTGSDVPGPNASGTPVSSTDAPPT
ncbi:small-conductance mechanosensitive channel [Luteibacter rhizovicinus]|uniref:Small-conductance mechanosensitive channel n=1 Tax=Luteibacter rhizovicinus TaxID=242606 RepID=A0A4V2W454_9GAMM|nr:DUF3772 domain-containing protein [Luteibacter rhizovicinus]TCV94569.1 small-conductance mechanosensitive channel [Luteibacter rhizovicinus]